MSAFSRCSCQTPRCARGALCVCVCACMHAYACACMFVSRVSAEESMARSVALVCFWVLAAWYSGPLLLYGTVSESKAKEREASFLACWGRCSRRLPRGLTGREGRLLFAVLPLPSLPRLCARSGVYAPNSAPTDSSECARRASNQKVQRAHRLFAAAVRCVSE